MARAALHFWEEPCISGTNGSGAVFFSGCTLQCCFCQNHAISRRAVGKRCTVGELADIFLRLQEEGAHNINLVTGTQFAPWILSALDKVKQWLHIPIVWNSSGYESLETLTMLDGYIDIYLPDFKFFSPETAEKLAGCPDYVEVAKKAVLEMFRQADNLAWNETLLQSGLILRHLVLPGHRKESMALLAWIAKHLPKDKFLLSLMGQYTPPAQPLAAKELNRKITTWEYEQVREYAVMLGLNGFGQDRTAADCQYIPEFDTSIG